MPPHAMELVAGVIFTSDAVTLVLVLALIALVVIESWPAPSRPATRPDRSPVAALRVRRAWQTSGRRRRDRLAGRADAPPAASASVASLWIGPPSPAMLRLRARSAFRHPSPRDLAIARYPY